MAAHSPLTLVVPAVPPDQPPGAWPSWLRGMAEAINHLIGWVNQPVLRPQLFAALPPAPMAGTLALITDGAGGPVGPASGGGSSLTLIWYTGTEWRVLATS